MYRADYHMHTNFSSDSDTPMESMIQKSIELGLSEIAITDHVDFDYPDEDFPFLIDYSEYMPVFTKLKEKYSGQINILFGVEIGLQAHIENEIKNLCAENDFDFIIGSTHCADKFDLCAPDFFEGKTKSEAYNRYFENILESIRQYPQFNVYGHLDAVNRYGIYGDNSLNYSEHKEITDYIFRELISRGKGIEINTSGLRYGVGDVHPGFEMVKRYRELGGEILTIGSDAHKPENIAQDFGEAYTLAKEAGFKAITIFRNKKPVFMDF
ncbi:MAG: histidinol-phosphatase HisJ family protein [Firmicutes bacterium]|nr:histidinol-phosphatase HisJ family protein [Bacillota bacterium]